MRPNVRYRERRDGFQPMVQLASVIGLEFTTLPDFLTLFIVNVKGLDPRPEEGPLLEYLDQDLNT